MDPDGDALSKVYQELSSLETEFADVELQALRHKELALNPLYIKRQVLLDRIPDFWPIAIGNSPDDVQQYFSDSDLAILACIKSLSIERHQIESETKGDPRSLRFIFDFKENEYFEDIRLVKEFRFQSTNNGSGGLVSIPVPIKWKSKKKDVTGGLLDAAMKLYQAEDVMKLKNGEVEIDMVERESLWQYEELREKLVRLEERSSGPLSFFNWFGYRGAIMDTNDGAKFQSPKDGQECESDVEEEDEEDAYLDVEIFPAGEEIAVELAEEWWPTVMNYFMAAKSAADDQSEEDEDEQAEGSSDGEAPDLIPVENGRPPKRQRME